MRLMAAAAVRRKRSSQSSSSSSLRKAGAVKGLRRGHRSRSAVAHSPDMLGAGRQGRAAMPAGQQRRKTSKVRIPCSSRCCIEVSKCGSGSMDALVHAGLRKKKRKR